MRHPGSDGGWPDGSRYGPGGHEMGHLGRMGEHLGPLEVVVMIAVLALVVAGLIWLIRRATRPSAIAQTSGAALRPDGVLEELRMRYARGELNREEFLQRNADLGGAPPGSEVGS